MIKYRTWYNNEITKVEVVRETEKCVIINKGGKEQKSAKHSIGINYWDTWEEAHNFLLNELREKLIRLQRQLETEHEQFDLLNEMKEE